MSDGDGSWRDRIPSLSQTQQNRLIVVAVLLMLFVSPVAAALLNSTPVQKDTVVGAQDGPVVTFKEPADGAVNLRDAWPDKNTVQYNSTAGNMELSSSGFTNATVLNITGEDTVVNKIHTPGSRSLTLNPEDKQSVVVSGEIRRIEWGNTSTVKGSDGTADFRYRSTVNGGDVTIGGLNASQTYTAKTGTGSTVGTFTTDANGTATLSLPGETSTTGVFIGDSDGPIITNAKPADGATLEAPETELSAQVNNSAFVSDNDTVEVKFYLNGNVVSTQTISENQTVSTDVRPPLGEQSTWRMIATDSYGNLAVVSQRTFTVPSSLRIYDERNPNRLIDDPSLNITVTFHPLDADSDNVTTARRTAENGTVNLTGLPADEPFTITAGATNQTTSDYAFRRIVVDSLYSTNRIYLLNKTGDNSQVVFELQDPTGRFPPSQTILFVEKPITSDYDDDGTNETRYQTIAGDTFGASSQFPVILANDARYRLRVTRVNDANERILGAYNVYGDAREPLKIDRIEPSADSRNQDVVYGGLEGEGNQTQLAIRYRGEADTTVEYTVYNGSGGVVVPTTTTQSTQFAHIYPANESKTYRVNYTVSDQNGTVVEGSWTAGRISGIADRLSMDGQVLSIISWVLILSSMGLIVILDPRLAPAGGTGMATALTIIGTVAIPGPLLGVAGAVSVLTLFGGNQ